MGVMCNSLGKVGNLSLLDFKENLTAGVLKLWFCVVSAGFVCFISAWL